MQTGLGNLLEAIAGHGTVGQTRCLTDDTMQWLSYGEVIDRAAKQFDMLAPSRGRLAMIETANDTNTALAILAAFSAGVTVMLVDPGLSEDAKARLMNDFRPEWRYVPLLGWIDTGMSGETITPGTALLLSTSGTTGTSRFVRLPLSAVLANARQIALALHITPEDSAVCHLPLHYSYGLSVLLSHLERGAASFITTGKITSPELWECVAKVGGTHFPGVPFHYSTLARLDINRLLPKCVTSFTQAGGHLDLVMRQKVHAQIAERGGRFYVMYGQTEAAPRMTTLDPARFTAKPDSVGSALEGGRIEISDEDEIIYHGPNVMWGYASTRSDLSRGDELGGRLATGDKGRLDADGDLFITGRNSRFAKIAGLRIGLDEMERRLKPSFNVVLVAAEESIRIYCDRSQNVDALREQAQALAREYKIPERSFVLRQLEEIPYLPNGKINFAFLRDVS